MNLGTFLQTIITIIFIYLILSLIASELQENIAAVCELRARRLKDSIQQMLGDKEGTLTEALYTHPNISALNQSAYSWFSRLTQARDSVGPSYISDSSLVAKTIIAIIKNDNQSTTTSTTQSTSSIAPLANQTDSEQLTTTVITQATSLIAPLANQTDSEQLMTTSTIQATSSIASSADRIDLKEYENNAALKNLANYSNNDWNQFELNLKRQYEEVQERSSGVYKRNAKGLSLVIGFLVAIIANADALNMIANLSKTNQNYSDNLIKKIEAKSPQLFSVAATGGKELTKDRRDVISTIVDEAGILPLGWDFDLEMEKQKQADENTKKLKLIELLTNNQDKIEFLSKNEGECKDEKGKTKCFDYLFNQIESSKEVVNYLGPDFIDKLNKSDRENFPTAYVSLLANLKNEQRAKIFSKPEQPKVSLDSFINNLYLNVQKQGGWKATFGWIISAVAISMGAPFWFDVLGNIMNVRNSGRDLKRKRN